MRKIRLSVRCKALAGKWWAEGDGRGLRIIPRITGDYFVKTDKQELYQGNFVDNHPKNPEDNSQYRFLTALVFAI
ncbi:hypothetical protein Xbud_00635 [Xenorhabdus budapestensis]|uniref:Uncharacterized protein n=1 Tax=Xenorhabdus budapestensis TaxID=290110 RepID=A0A2D0J3Y7_XENBU|nr:hypothetical protein Xbud_00635 [Xenorhabdus budapestensis]